MDDPRLRGHPLERDGEEHVGGVELGVEADLGAVSRAHEVGLAVGIHGALAAAEVHCTEGNMKVN